MTPNAAADRHVAIVGAGVVGLCAADALLDRGFRVTIFEKERDEETGCSYGNGGLVVPSHFVPLAAPGMVAMGLRMMADRRSPFGVARLLDWETLAWSARFALAGTPRHVARCAPVLRDLNLASREIYARLCEELAVPFERRGLLMLCQTQKAQDGEARLADDANRLGLKATVLGRDEVARLEPGVTMDVAGGVLFRDDAHLTPALFMRALRARVLSRGAEIVHREVTDLKAVGADTVVVAGGSWSGRLAKSLGLRLPLMAGRGYGATATRPPQTPKIPAIFTEARVAVTPMADGVRFVGTMELAGPVVQPTSPRVDAMRESVSRFYPAYRPEHLDGPVWCGLRPCSPDGMPYVGRTKRAGNVVFATGHAMMGMSLGPITGRLVAEIVAGDPPSLPLDLLNPDRYA